MAASGGGMSKKKQEEETLKSLREIASVQSNKQCFDCAQKGPTYLNMTIGCFVCTACSGLLRGLNPPQRVKSVSMASFTPEEIEFIKSRGNDFCRKVWLGQSSESPSQYAPGARDEMKIRDMMSLRYEKKRWYVAPTEVMHEEARKLHSSATAANKPKQSQIIGKNNTLLISATTTQQLVNRTSPITEPKPAPLNQSNPVSPTSMLSSTVTQQQGPSGAVKSVDLLADLGVDPFAQQMPAQQQQSVENGAGGFANFGNFSSSSAPPSLFSSQPSSTLHNTSFVPPLQAPMGTSSQLQQWSSLGSSGQLSSSAAQQQQQPVHVATSAEKYSAIAEIDGVFGQQSAGPLTGGGNMSSVNWNSSQFSSASTHNQLSSSSTMFGSGMSSSSASTSQQQPANPFGAGMPGSSQSTSVANPFMQPQASHGMFGQPPAPGGYISSSNFSSQPNSFGGPPPAPPSYMQVTGGGYTQHQAFPSIPAGAGGFSSQPGGFGAQSFGGAQMTQPMFGVNATAGGGQYYGTNQPVQPSANPFMNAAVPRSTNTSNPFL